MRRLRAKTQSVRLNDYKRFLDQAISKNGDLIKEHVMVGFDTHYHIQAMRDDNWQGETKQEIKAIENNKT